MKRHTTGTRPKHVNAFLDLSNIPYLLSEYIDRRDIQQIDRDIVRTDVYVDQKESMRAIIDINIDDIGRRGSDGRLAIKGNNSKQRHLLDIISKNCVRLDHQLDVIRPGIVIRVNYRLENYRTRQVLRSMTEDLRCRDRSYFMDINPREINDNAIIVNFANSMVSTINEFTHGIDKMIIRITDIQLFYECLSRVPNMEHIDIDHTFGKHHPCDGYGDHYDYYRHHEDKHYRPRVPSGAYGDEDVRTISHPDWDMFNRFYHFDNGGKDIILHPTEINDPSCRVKLIPCGKLTVNRTFMINPGHRIIYKFSIWKNDLTIVTDTTKVAQTLRAPIASGYFDPAMFEDNRKEDREYDHLLRMLRETSMINNQQSYAIGQLTQLVKDLERKVRKLSHAEAPGNPDIGNPDDDGNTDKPDDPVGGDPITPEEPGDDNHQCDCDCDCDDIEAIPLDDIAKLFPDI